MDFKDWGLGIMVWGFRADRVYGLQGLGFRESV